MIDTASRATLGAGELDGWADTILPGDGIRWPAARIALGDPARVLALLSSDDAAWLLEFARRLAASRHETRGAIAAQAERDQPEPFARSVQALYRLYYTSDAVQRVVAALADAGPREASQNFDPTLLTRVVARKAGQRRL
jgi:hypothetical protein